MRSGVLTLLLALAGTSVAGPASRTEARRQVRAGAYWYRHHDYAKALSKYQRAYALRRRPDVLLSIALCHKQLGNWDDAIAVFAQSYVAVDVAGPAAEGLYIGGGLQTAIPLGELWVVPIVSFQWSPDLNYWGASAMLVIDRPVASWLSLDFGVSIGEEQAGFDFSTSDIYVGTGPAVSLVYGPAAFTMFVAYFRA